MIDEATHLLVLQGEQLEEYHMQGIEHFSPIIITVRKPSFNYSIEC
jgi:hypothetical protein